MTVAVFVDTNVLVYARDAREPEKQPAAARWLEQLWIEQRGPRYKATFATKSRHRRPGRPRKKSGGTE